MDMAEYEKPRGQLSGKEAAGSFFKNEKRILNDIAGGKGFTFKRGDGWSINPETGEATYDTRFFEEKGYTRSQALFGALHEIKCHLVEASELLSTSKGQEAYERLKERGSAKQRLSIWENCRTDVKGNLAIARFAPSLAKDMETVYREKLWPEKDFTSEPKHLQFMYSILRTAMVPDEKTVVDLEVEEAIKKLRNVKGKDVVGLATDPTLDPLLALRLSERYIEPVIEELYSKDLQEREKQQNSKGKGKDGAPSGREADIGGEPFAENYKNYENRHPRPMGEGEMEKKIKEIKAQHSEGARQRAAYEQEHGVSEKDVVNYLEEYRLVEGYIEPLRDVFRKIVEERKVSIRQLASHKEEGVMIDPGLVAQTYMEVESGVENPKTMKDFEGNVISENIPGKAYLYFLYDQSYSMKGRKAVLQLRGAILAAEALKEGDDMLREQQFPDPLALDIQSAFYGFGSPEGVSMYKPIYNGISEKQRVDFFKGLLEFGKIGTNDYDGLVKIEKDVKEKIASDPGFADDLKSGKRRACVVVTTDGGSNYKGLSEEQARQQTKKKAEELRGLGVKVKAIAMAPEKDDIQNIQEVYGMDETNICESVDQYPKSMELVLGDILESLKV